MATVEATKTAEREITITRVFDAPRALVFKAWTDGAQLAAKLVIDIAGDRHMRVEHQG